MGTNAAAMGSRGKVSPRADQQMAAGADAFAAGQMEQAIGCFKDAMNLYRAAGASGGFCDASQNLGIAYQCIGQANLALDTLGAALKEATRGNDKPRMMSLTGALGGAAIYTRQANLAEPCLTQALQMAKDLGDEQAQASILNDLGNLYAARGDTDQAVDAYQQSIGLCGGQGNELLLAKATTNAAAAAAKREDSSQAKEFNRQALDRASALPASYDKAHLLTTIGKTDADVKESRAAYDAYMQAITVASSVGSDRAGTYAWGYLGELYENAKRADDAMLATRKALFLAQKAQSPDAIYRWQWQVARLQRDAGDVEPAIASYGRAIDAIKSIRHDMSIVYGNRNVRSSFRKGVGPIFYQYADILLKRADNENDPQRVQQYLLAARDAVEMLKGAELEDYFQDDCVNLVKSKSQLIDQNLQRTAVVYVIPLPDRIELLLSLPAGLKRFTSKVTDSQLRETARTFRANLEDRETFDFKETANQLYDWIIRPIEPALKEQKIDTLVFVPDGELRAVPAAAFMDGMTFLIERYAVAVTPGLTLTDPEPLTARKRIEVLRAGLSEARDNVTDVAGETEDFPALPNVPEELKKISSLYDGTTLEDQDFVLPNVRREFSKETFNIVHIASHGQFKGDAKRTFLLTYDGTLNLDDLESLIQPSQFRGEPVDLITLSACQTAAGDDSARAALGLAGVAIKAGARSALATLWFVNDESSSDLVATFYEQLKDHPTMTKAKALQQAQLKLIHDPGKRYIHPSYWAPYLLIGNWL